MSSAAYEPVATTEETASSFPTRSRKYRVIAAVVLVLSVLGLASLYKSGIWAVPSARVGTPSDTEEKNNNTGKETQTIMSHGKYSVG